MNSLLQLFGEEALSAPPSRPSVRSVGELVRCALVVNNDPNIYRELLLRVEAVEAEIRGLISDSAEREFLQKIVDAVPLIEEPLSNLCEPLIAYTAYLERESCLDDAMKMLALTAGVYRPQISPSEFATICLNAARLHRELTHWERASRCYAEAEKIGAL